VNDSAPLSAIVRQAGLAADRVFRYCAVILAGATMGIAARAADAPRPWLDYRTILWVGDSAWQQPEKLPLFLQRLREMGVNTAMVHGERDPTPFVEHRFPYYVENLVNKGLCLKWNSNVRDWDRFVTEWARNGRPESAFGRDYCLEDPSWRAWAREQVRQLAQKNQPHAPLAYNLRDELSTTISANPFDYDFSPASQAKFREWLQSRYASLSALNAAWETRFASWAEVQPFSTDRIKNRMASGEADPRGQPDWQVLQRLSFDPIRARRESTRWNFAPWCDFRSFMDQSLADCLDDLRQAAHAVDPHTPVGIEGTQMPHAFGGYDLWRLSQAIDWVEPYDIGNAREIFGSFMPGKPILTTVFETKSNPARRRLWHLLLEGDRGCIVWWSEDCIDWTSPDLALTPKARALAPVLQEMTSPLAQLFLRAERQRDPIYLHYSPPSIQVDWLIESTVDGSTWPRRFSSFEAEHNQSAKVRNAWLKAFQDLGWEPRFISSAQLEKFALGPADPCVLVLPRSYALSDREIAAIESVFRGPFSGESAERLVLADGTPGIFDEHGRLRAASPLEHQFPPAKQPTVYAWRSSDSAAPSSAIDTAGFPAARLRLEPDTRFWNWLRDHVAGGYVKLPTAARARVHRFRAGNATLIAVERNVDYQMSEELKQAGGNEALERPVELTAELSPLAHSLLIYDLRTGRQIGEGKKWKFTLDPWTPSLFALTADRIPEERLLPLLLEAMRHPEATQP
jgi:hypothetical protein